MDIATIQFKQLTSEQSVFYEEHGFLILPHFIDDSECSLLIKTANELINQFDESSVQAIFSTKHHHPFKEAYFLDSAKKIHFFFEEDAFDDECVLVKEKQYAINKIGHALHDLNPVFKQFSYQKKLIELAEDLNIKDPRLIQSMYICKQPYIGGEVTCHQDATFLYVDENPITGFWFALEDATIENGCLWTIPGGHFGNLKSRMRKKENKMYMETLDDSPWQMEKLVPLEVKKGTLIVLHGLLPHLSKKNTSSKSRHAYTLHVMSRQDKFAADNWLVLD